ncbi:hypothetical protein [Sphingobium bisphenolivorans]|jgi:hypothetical protein|uniref:hypothetical protein n=1 Tax=Sphingomonadales TaxID=204457 RepID=UPI0003A18039|tara:strand:+ start:1972 stop:2241 length:270 start_codon:yes stop_codon:yes gene_type:complete
MPIGSVLPHPALEPAVAPALAIVAQAATVERGPADVELDLTAPTGDLDIARIEIVAAGIVIRCLLAAELAGLFEFPRYLRLLRFLRGAR